MNKQELQNLQEKLDNECLNTKNIFFSTTIAKGILTLFWSITHLTSNIESFEKHEDEIEWANLKLLQLEKKYKEFHIKTRLLLEKDAHHFDEKMKINKEPPLRKSWQTQTQSMGGFIQFKF